MCLSSLLPCRGLRVWASARVLALLPVVIPALLPSAATFAQPRPPTATNKLFLHSKPAVVRIYAGFTGQWQWNGQTWRTGSVGSGSGFILNPDGYILTNAHVVSDIRDGDQAGKRSLLFQLAVQALRARGLAVNQASVLQAAGVLNGQASLVDFRRINVVVLQSGRRFPFEIKSYGAPSGQGNDLATGKDVAVLKIEIKNAPTLRVGNSDSVQVGDRIYVMGFPGAADSSLLDQKSALEPTINDGSISAKKTSADGAPILQTNTSATHGNSGGPAINEKGEVIGLLTFRGNTVNGQEIQGFNFLVPTSTAQEFIRQAGVDNRESPVDRKWQQGLDAYWGEEYRNAQGDFQEVLALYADHSEAARLVADCKEHIARGDDKSGLVVLGWVGALGCGFLILVVGGVILLVVLNRRKAAPAKARPGPSQPPPPQASKSSAPMKTEVFRGGMAGGRLICTLGPLQGQEFPLHQGFYIGRDASRAQVVVLDAQVSGQHVWVGALAGRMLARDPGSTNGTFLEGRPGERITEVELKDGDVLVLGGAGTLKFMYKA